MVNESGNNSFAAPGERIAEKFVVERVIGEGGMGLVLLAMHEQLGERVALKFLRQEALANPEIVARFKNEARAAVRLKSNHVARVIDVGSHQGVPFMVMEYLEGGDLASLIATRGALPVEEACELIIQACEGLAEAHSRQIVHRDIKPENLFIVRSHGLSALKILDFGISKAALSERDNLVQTTQIMGSPYYMSPEQLRSTKHVDHRADIWSLGSVLFELLSAERPFEATDSLAHLIAAIALEQPRDLGRLRGGLPPDLIRIVLKCLQKDPNLRFQNTGELAIALLPFASRRAYPIAERAVNVLRGSDVPGASMLQLPPEDLIRASSSSGRLSMPGFDAPRAAFDTTALLDSSPNVTGSGAPGSDPRLGPSAMARSEAALEVKAATTTSGVSNAAVAAGEKRTASLVVLAAAVVVALGAAAFILTRPQSNAAAVQPPVPSATAVSESIDVILRAEPKETKFTIDDGPPLENPYVGKHPKEDVTHVIRARAPGYKEKVREVTFAADVTLGLQLSKEKQGGGQ